MPLTNESRNLMYQNLVKQFASLSPPMVLKKDDAAMQCELTGNTPVPYGYNKKIIPGMYFASVAQRKDSVAFYFFPAYMNKEFATLAPALFKCLKGKTCFHFKKPEDLDEKELMVLLKKGLQAWEKAGYVVT